VKDQRQWLPIFVQDTADQNPDIRVHERLVLHLPARAACSAPVVGHLSVALIGEALKKRDQLGGFFQTKAVVGERRPNYAARTGWLAAQVLTTLARGLK